MNVLFLLVLVLAVIKIVSGYKRGMVKEVIMLVSLIITCIMVALITNGMKSYSEGEIFHVVLMVLMLIVLGIVQFAL